jgi:hypothetical protein
MSIERLDIERLLAADMRPLLDDEGMTNLVLKCGGVILDDGNVCLVSIAGIRAIAAVRADALNQALDIIAIRPDLWPGRPSAA